MPAAVLVTLLALVLLSVASAAGGDLDRSFGDGGRMITAVGASSTGARAVAIQRDGKIIVAGFVVGSGPLLVRYGADGALDPAFGSGGRTPTVGVSLALQRDGAILVAGAAAGDLVVARHRPDGSLDRSFGGAGIVTTDLGGDENGRPSGRSVLVQPDGKIVVVASSRREGVSRFALARYRADGALDPSFGDLGKVVRVDAEAVAAALAPGGKVVVMGGFGPLVVARFDRRGNLDRSFSRDGVTTSPAGPGAFPPTAMAVGPDGKVVVVRWGAPGSVHGVLRFRADGSPDGRFGEGAPPSPAGTPVYEWRAAVLDARGRVVLAGHGPDTWQNFVVGRLTPSGRLDRRFGVAGVVTTSFGAGAGAHAVGVQRDGKVVAAGWQSPTERRIGAPDVTFALARYAATTCRVPPLIGKSLRAATRELRRRGCVRGVVTRARSPAARAGRVLRQRPAAGTVVADHRPVAVVVGRGRR